MCIMCTLLGLDKTADYETLKEWCLIGFNYLLKIDPQHSFLVKEIEKVILKIDIRGSNRDGSEMIRFDMIHLITISLC